MVTEDHWYPARSSTPITWVSGFAFYWSQLLSVCVFNLSLSVAQTNWTNFSTCTSHSLKFYWKWWFPSCPTSPPGPHRGGVSCCRFLLRLIIEVYTQWLTHLTYRWSTMTQTDRRTQKFHQISSPSPNQVFLYHTSFTAIFFFCNFIVDWNWNQESSRSKTEIELTDMQWLLMPLRCNNFLIWKVLINSGWGKVRACDRSVMAGEIEYLVCNLLWWMQGAVGSPFSDGR